jgi:molybdopterin/thiamine biosynthesis adenylyltransferase
VDQKYRERFLRNIGIMNEAQLETIKNTSIAIGGLGLGGSIFLNLVRLGFEKFHVADPDVYERTNINRQRMAKETTINVRKDQALIYEAREINPGVKIRSFPEGVSNENVSEFLEGIDWVVDVVDVFAIDAKLALNAEAARRGLPVVSCGAIGFAASVVVFDHTTPTFAEVTGMAPDLPSQTNIERFVRFICPEVPLYMQAQLEKALRRESHIPFVCPGVEVSAAFASSEIAKDILGIGRAVRAPSGIHIDPSELRIEIYSVAFDRGLRKVA